MPTNSSPINPKNILIYVGSDSDDAIGENIIKLVFARAVRAAYPGARITWIPGYGPQCLMAGLLSPLAGYYIDDMLVDVDLDAESLFGSSMRHEIFTSHYDLIIDTQSNLLRTLKLRLIPHNCFISRNWRYFFSTRFPPSTVERNPKRLIEKLLLLLTTATRNPVRPDHRLDVDPASHDLAEKLLPDGPVYIGLAPGAGKKDTGKCWPLEKFMQVAGREAEKNRAPVFLLGPNEKQWRPVIQGEISTALFPELDARDRFSNVHGPSLLIALAARLDAAVANCSGTGHMLAAGGVPLISLFGPTSAEKFAPYTPAQVILDSREFGGNDISLIPSERVSAEIDQIIDDHGQYRTASQRPDGY